MTLDHFPLDHLQCTQMSAPLVSVAVPRTFPTGIIPITLPYDALYFIFSVVAHLHSVTTASAGSVLDTTPQIAMCQKKKPVREQRANLAVSEQNGG